MTPKELLIKLCGEGMPYPGMPVEWECFAGDNQPETGVYRGLIVRISWCSHCGEPTFLARTDSGATFEIRLSEKGARWVCGQEAPK